MFSIDNLFMLVHPFGWFIFTICAFVLVLLLYCSHKQILQCCQESLQPMWHSTSEAFHSLCDWVGHSFQSVWTTASRASIASSMRTPNVVGPINNVQGDHKFRIQYIWCTTILCEKEVQSIRCVEQFSLLQIDLKYDIIFEGKGIIEFVSEEFIQNDVG